MTDHAELIEPSPVDRGEFVGDIFYGDPTNSTRGTHRWTGAAWEALPTDAEVLTLMLAEARARVDALVAERDALREALKPFAKEAALWRDAYDPPPEDEPMWIGCRKNRFMTDEAAFTLGDLRRAALAQEPRNV